jgi:hypothetical protein
VPRKKGTTKELIQWRRNEVAIMLSRGKTVNDIAARLQLQPRTIYEDLRYIRQNANQVLNRYLVETLPVEISKCLLRLNQVSNESWAIVDDNKLDAREKLAALARAESAVSIIEFLTNNKELIYTALGRKQPPAAISFAPSVLSQAMISQSAESDQQDDDQGDGTDFDGDDAEAEVDDGEEEEEEPIPDHEFYSQDFKRDRTGQDPEAVF